MSIGAGRRGRGSRPLPTRESGWRAPPARIGHGGVDGILREDAVGLDAVYVQAKCYAVGDPVGVPTVQAALPSAPGQAL